MLARTGPNTFWSAIWRRGNRSRHAVSGDAVDEVGSCQVGDLRSSGPVTDIVDCPGLGDDTVLDHVDLIG